MAGGDAADPWSAPGGDPWSRDDTWNAGAEARGEAVVNEPNAEMNATTESEPTQSRGNQEGGDAAACAANSWQRGDWTSRDADSWHQPRDGSSDGSGSGDTTTASGRRFSDMSGHAWSHWDPWWEDNTWDQWHRSWQTQWWHGRDSSSWSTSWPESTTWWSSNREDGDPTAGTTTTSTRRSTYRSDDGEPTAGITPTPRRSSAPTTRAGDDWPETTHPVRESGAGGPKGPSEKLLIPTFSGDVEGTGDLGTSARSYLRQIAAWEKMTKLSPDQRALVLYQNLQGSAWVNSESLCVDDLAQKDGVQVLRSWITQHYLDVEVTQVGRSLSDLFRKLKRRSNQTFRDYTSEFNRLLARVTECGCKLPDMATAWLYVDRASLDEATEVSLLASVGNRYALRDLQQAAIILDRSIRKPWERNTKSDGTSGRRFNSVNHTEEIDIEDQEHSEQDFDLTDRIGEDTADLYVTYMTAKARYREATKARGTEQNGTPERRGPDPTAVKKAAEAKVQLAKSKSFCAACGQRGHWHRDAVCPQRSKVDRPQTVHVTNEISELAMNGHPELHAILDSACSKTVVGTGWLERYLGLIRGKDYDYGFIYEREAFKFGAASKIYESSYAAVILVPIFGHCVAIKAAVIHGDIPLLVSRPALAKLGLIMDLGRSTASFRTLGDGEMKLLETSSGHPAILVDHSGLRSSDVTRIPKSWEQHGVAIVSPRSVYMVACQGVSGLTSHSSSSLHSIPPKVFHDKKINPAIRDMLVADALNDSVFLEWWTQTDIINDFWIETDTKLVRVHVTPRKNFFNPQSWQTSHVGQRELLLRQIGSLRETWGIGCMSRRVLCTVTDVWQDQQSCGYPTLWIGRSVFNRAQAPHSPRPAPRHEQRTPNGNMEDEQGTTSSGVPSAEFGSEQQVDVSRVEDGPDSGQGVGRHARHPEVTQGTVDDEPGRAARRGGEDRHGGGAPRDTRKPDAEDQGQLLPRRHGDGRGTLQGEHLPGHPGELCTMGVRRGASERPEYEPGLEKICAVEASPQEPELYEFGPHLRPPGSRSVFSGARTTDQRDGVLDCMVSRGRGAPRLHEGRALSTEDADELNPGDRGQGEGDETREIPRGRGPCAHGAGDHEQDKEGDRDVGGEAGGAQGQVRLEAAPLSRGGTRGSAPEHSEGAHDMHHETFLSCSSVSEDSTEEVMLTDKALHRLGDELVGVRPQDTHQGERAARDALQAQDFSFETAGTILKRYEIHTHVKKRPEIHKENPGGRIALGYYAYGNFKGICTRTVRWPQLTKYLNRFLYEYVGSSVDNGRPTFWSSITVLKDCPAAMHTDKNNLRGSPNYVISFGAGRGGGLWVERPGGGVWRRTRNGDDLEGTVLDTNGQAWEFDPRLRHASEPAEGERWVIAGYTARSYPGASKLEKRVLRGLEFRIGTSGDIAAIKKTERKEFNTDPAEGHLQRRKPRRSTRKALWKTAAYLSVMFTTVMSVMGEAVREAVPALDQGRVSMLELGGVSATCRLAELGDAMIHAAEPVLFEDILYNDHPTDIGFGFIEASVMRLQPRQLWIHVAPEWSNEDAYHDLVEAIGLQLSEGRAVVFERNIEENELWQDLIGGWAEAGYTVDREVDEDGTETVRIIYDFPEQYINEVFAGEDGQEPREGQDQQLEPPGQEPGEEVAPIAERGAKAIRFPPSVPGRIATSLRRLHQNLGHPSTPDFTRHLRLAGASKDVLKAARGLECEVCRRCKAPAIPRPSRIAPCLRFNQVVGVDIFYVHDSEGVRHQLLSMVDHSSAYHVVVPIAKKDTTHLERAFCDAWINVFGAPAAVYVDMENGLEKSLARIGDWTGTHVRTAAGQAHFQAGYTERQGGIWKSIFARLNDEMSICRTDMHLAISSVSSSKNSLTRTSGYSPQQHVFGTVPNLPEDLLDGPHAESPSEEPIVDEAHARQVALRTAARAAYFHVQTDERVRRALAGRTRVTARRPEVGERVFYFRKTKNAKRGLWVGPGTVIGEEGSNLWVTRGGRCILCAPEHVRLATSEELGEAFSLRAARDDLDRLLHADQEDENIFDEDGEPIDDGGGTGYIDYDDEVMEDIEEMALDHEGDGQQQRGQRRDLERTVPVVLKRQRRKGRQEPTGVGGAHEVHMLKKAKTERSREKQLEKEIPWELIPEAMRETFRAAEAKQWAEHVDSGALEVLSIKESERIRATVPANRILPSRYAYRDKHMGLRRINPETPWKAKARLVVAGHQDPDVGAEGLVVDSPTVSRSALLTVLQICASKAWQASAGDIQAAFLQGVELRRELWMSQPRGGVEGLHPQQLARIRKGVFGLSESPRMWYDRLSNVLLGEVFNIDNKVYRLRPSPCAHAARKRRSR